MQRVPRPTHGVFSVSLHCPPRPSHAVRAASPQLGSPMGAGRGADGLGRLGACAGRVAAGSGGRCSGWRTGSVGVAVDGGAAPALPWRPALDGRLPTEVAPQAARSKAKRQIRILRGYAKANAGSASSVQRGAGHRERALSVSRDVGGVEVEVLREGVCPSSPNCSTVPAVLSPLPSATVTPPCGSTTIALRRRAERDAAHRVVTRRSLHSARPMTRHASTTPPMGPRLTDVNYFCLSTTTISAGCRRPCEGAVRRPCTVPGSPA